MKEYLVHPVFKIISEIVTRQDTPAFVIGGFVRDSILHRPTKDIDIMVLGSGIDLAHSVAERIGGNTPVSVFKNFGTAMLHFKGMEIEFVGARSESYRKNSRKPIVEKGTLEDDLKRRDFTINALAIRLNEETFGQLVDAFDGLKDLQDKLIRTPLEPSKTFSDDPLRMLRAVRFSTQLNFTIDPVTFNAIGPNANRLEIISGERILDELQKIMACPRPSVGFKLLDKSGLLQYILPELCQLKGIEIKEGKGHKDNFIHTLKVLDNVSAVSENTWLRWAALLHDIAKPATKKFSDKVGWTFHGHDFLGAQMIPGIFRKLKLPLDQRMKYVQKIIAMHLRPSSLVQEEVTDSAVRRLLFDAGENIDDLMCLCEADITSKNEETVKKYLQNFKLVRKKLIEIEEKDALRNFQPPVDGQDIMLTFNLKPCREVGLIKNAIKDAILDGIISNNPDSAYQFMLKKGEELGLKAVKK